jgi:hypothetical protein
MHDISSSNKKILNLFLDENFSYGYDGKLYNLRSDTSSLFQCHYKKSTRQYLSLREEAVLVCEKISDKSKQLNSVPTILLSGGLDSEIVLRAFLESGREFRAISNRFNDNLNDHEIFYIEKLKEKFDFDHSYVDLDIVEFLNSEDALTYIDLSQCTKPEMLPTMKLLEHVYKNLNGIPVLGNGDFYVGKDNNSWNYIEYEYILAWMRFCVSKNIVAATNFFQFTPEIVLSVGKDTLMHHLFANSPEGKVSSRSTKYLVYKKNWIDAELRPKFHGSEKVMEICDFLRNGVCKKYDMYTELWKMPVDQFLSMLDYEI